MIEVDDLFVLYRGALHDVVALRGLNLKVGPGERVVVHGPSGSGKSTLVSVLTGSVMPSAGRARMFGIDVVAHNQSRQGSRRARRRWRAADGPASSIVGLVTQGSGNDLFPELTCVQNVALQARLGGMSKTSAEAVATEALDRFGVQSLSARLPGTLSNGEAQRVGVAAALVCLPKVIIADEPTGELDRHNADLVYRLLADQAVGTGAAVLLVTHDPRAAQFADRTITIRDGRVSDERIGAEERLIVDGRGWVRLPANALRAAAISDRVCVDALDVDPGALRLVPPGQAALVSLAEHTDRTSTDGVPSVGAPDVLSVPPELGVGDSSEPVMATDAVTASIGGVEVLAPTDLSIDRGLVVIAGPSGCGKTTLLGLLAGIGAPTGGAVHIRKGVTTAVGTLLAGFAESLDPIENITIARAARGHIDSEAAAILDVLSSLGIGHLVGRPVQALSGGERQRVGIARALCSGASVVLLDEPTSQLDEASAASVAHVLAQFGQRQPIICTSHDETLISLADQVIRLG
jgi:ABC-type lipoprotein export system ATPase subunit